MTVDHNYTNMLSAQVEMNMTLKGPRKYRQPLKRGRLEHFGVHLKMEEVCRVTRKIENSI